MLSIRQKFTVLAAVSLLASQAFASPITIEKQGSFAVGGTVKTSAGQYTPVPEAIKGKSSNPFWDVYEASIAAGGQTLHGDHASVFYQIPVNAKPYPLVFLHGYGQSARTWQTTPDGREGFGTIFLRKGYPIYLIDQPRRGQAGQSTVATNLPAVPDDQFWYAQFRIGVYPNMNKGVAFPKDAASQDQFFRQMTPDTGAFDVGVIGWTTAMQSDKVKGIIAVEPGSFPFPEGEVPPTQTSQFGDVAPMTVSKAQFERLTKVCRL